MTLSASICVFLGWMQLRSAFAKMRHPMVFWSILQQYPLGSWAKSPMLARAVPVAEIVLAAGLLLPFASTRLPACCGVLAFVACASVAIYLRFHRGEERFACGCSANLEEEMRASGMLVRNGVLLIAATAGAVWSPQRAGIAEYGIGLVLLLAFDVLQTALVQEGRVQSWKTFGSRPT